MLTFMTMNSDMIICTQSHTHTHTHTLQCDLGDRVSVTVGYNSIVRTKGHGTKGHKKCHPGHKATRVAVRGDLMVTTDVCCFHV